MKKFLSFALAFLVTLAIFSPSGVEAAQTKARVELSKQEIKQLKENLEEIGVKANVQEKLIEKYQNGEVWDSMNPSVTSKLSEDLFTLSSKDPVKSYTFPDGSVLRLKATVLEEKEMSDIDDNGSITPFEYSRCGSGYCKFYELLVEASSGVQSAEFYADYVIVDDGYDYISDVYDYSIVTLAGDYTLEAFEIVRPRESADRDAYAKLQWKATAVGGTAAATSWIRFYVGSDDWYITTRM